MNRDSALTPQLVRCALSETFPSQNDFYECDYVEELNELAHFGVRTIGQLNDLLTKHKDVILEIDRNPADEASRQVYIRDYGEEFVKDREQKGFWFAFPALLRLALEEEFGDEYRKFADERDKG